MLTRIVRTRCDVQPCRRMSQRQRDAEQDSRERLDYRNHESAAGHGEHRLGRGPTKDFAQHTRKRRSSFSPLLRDSRAFFAIYNPARWHGSHEQKLLRTNPTLCESAPRCVAFKTAVAVREALWAGIARENISRAPKKTRPGIHRVSFLKVEAGRIELPSRDASTMPSTCVVKLFAESRRFLFASSGAT